MKNRTHLLAFCVLIALQLNGSAQDGSAPAPSGAQALLEAGIDDIVFACRQVGNDSHWYANFAHFVEDPANKAYRAKGRLCRMNLRTGEVTVLLDAPEGTIRDPQIHYDGDKILFSYRKPHTEYFHLYEIGINGEGLRQLTDGPYDDLEPTYLPNGDIVFCSSRCNRWVPCWMVPVAILYRCDGDGSNIRQISSNIEQENTPWPLPDGRLIYQRWEYVDRSRTGFHHLWTTNPDGTGQMVYYGNMIPDTLMIDAKPIPGADNQVVAIFSPGHGKREHAGAVTIVSPKTGPDDPGSAQRLTAGEDYRDPWPVTDNCFLVAREDRILVLNARGEEAAVYRLPKPLREAGVLVHEPRPLRKRPRERVIPDRVQLAHATGTLFLADVYAGRRMTGVQRGDIRKLLVLETLPKPVNFSGKMLPLSFDGTYQLERILGTVDVESDGSAYFEAPANRSLLFVALDEKNNSVKRMQSFTNVMPGEQAVCVGCHEQRTRAPGAGTQGATLAARRAPQPIQPLEGIPEIFDFPRDIQPILDRHCLKCHDYDKRSGGVILSGDHGPVYSHSFFTLTVRQEFVDGRDMAGGNLPPRTIGAVASPLMQKLGAPGEKGHHDVCVTENERERVRFWIESAAPYVGTYAALGTGMIGAYPNSQLDTRDRQWPESIRAAQAIEQRCLGCHDASKPLPRYLSDNFGITPSNLSLDDPRARYTRHLLFNLTRPEQSLMLLAPLARKAGGYGVCQTADSPDGAGGTAVFDGVTDADYQAILALCRAGRDHLHQIKRFDMEGFRPRQEYVRELKKFGILSADHPPDQPFDTYAADQAYWRSLWWQPVSQNVY